MCAHRAIAIVSITASQSKALSFVHVCSSCNCNREHHC